MNTLLVTAAIAMVGMVYCGEYTVTEEAWFEVEVKDMDGPGMDGRGRFVIALFGDVAPMTVLNFASIAKGYKVGKETLSYKNSLIHRVVPDFVIQMGDITTGDGTGGRSIYGSKFNDEEFILSHRSPGWVAMANHGADTNGSQFYILLTKARWLDGKHVVFGKVIEGMEFLYALGDVKTNPKNAIPISKVKIIDCGVNSLDKKYEIPEDKLDSTEDFSPE